VAERARAEEREVRDRNRNQEQKLVIGAAGAAGIREGALQPVLARLPVLSNNCGVLYFYKSSL
jgi:hypothetical protein